MLVTISHIPALTILTLIMPATLPLYLLAARAAQRLRRAGCSVRGPLPDHTHLHLAITPALFSRAVIASSCRSYLSGHTPWEVSSRRAGFFFVVFSVQHHISSASHTIWNKVKCPICQMNEWLEGGMDGYMANERRNFPFLS